MMRFSYFISVLLLVTSCLSREEQLRERAAELCHYIPDHELPERSRDYLTADFYAVLDTMFHMPEHEAMDHEWLYYFVTGNGGTISDFEIVDVRQTDETHAVATVRVRQKWEDGSFDDTSDVEDHRLYMELVDGRWLMSDFDEHKQDCIRHIAINRREQAVRDAMCEWLVREVGIHYLQGKCCIPSLLIVDEEEQDASKLCVWCDCYVYWYDVAGDTLKTVSGGNHAGCMTLVRRDGAPVVTNFEQTVDGSDNESSARRIFGDRFDVYQNMHSNPDVAEAVRLEQLSEYVRRHRLPVRYCQDYGRDAVDLFPNGLE